MRPPLTTTRSSLCRRSGAGCLAAAAALVAAAAPAAGRGLERTDLETARVAPPTDAAEALPGTPPAGPPNFLAPADPGEMSEIARTALVSDVERIVPGATFHLVFQVSLARGWHTYWEFAGASGMPPQFQVEAPAGYTVGTPRFPRPQRFRGPEGETVGYEGEAWIFIPVTAPRTLPTTNAPIRFTVDATYVVCRESCLIGSEQRTISLPAAGDPAAGPGRASARTAAWRERLPRPLDLRRIPATAAAPGAVRPELVIRVPDGAGRIGPSVRPEFIAAPRPGVEYGPARVSRDGEAWSIVVPIEYAAANATDGRLVVRGLVALGPSGADPVHQIEFTFPAGG